MRRRKDSKRRFKLKFDLFVKPPKSSREFGARGRRYFLKFNGQRFSHDSSWPQITGVVELCIGGVDGSFDSECLQIIRKDIAAGITKTRENFATEIAEVLGFSVWRSRELWLL